MEFISDIPFEKYLGRGKERDIFIWGKGSIGEKALNVLQKKGFQIAGVVDRDAALNVWHDITVKTPDYLKEKKGKIYCIIAIKEFQQTIEDYLLEEGYEEIEDYLFLFHKPTRIPAQPSYVDVYGNEWLGNVGGVFPVTAYNCKIHIDSQCKFECDFLACNSTITINENVSFGKGMIYCYKEGKLEIGEDSHFEEDCLIECYEGSTVSVGSHVRFESDAQLVCQDDSSIVVGDGCHFRRHSTLVALKNGILKMGRFCSLNRFFSCATHFSGAIEIGEGFMAARYVAIYNNDGHPIFDVVTGKQINSHRSIKISNHVWAGLKVTILSGADVGAACIIGANSIVNKKFPNNCTLAGMPAKILHENVTWEGSVDSRADERYWNLTERF